MAATTSCSPFSNLKSNPVKPRFRSPPRPSHGSPGCGKVNGAATWLTKGVASAFFGSMERCSCIRTATQSEDDGDAAADNLRLISNDGNYRHGGRNSGSRSARRGNGKRTEELSRRNK